MDTPYWSSWDKTTLVIDVIHKIVHTSYPWDWIRRIQQFVWKNKYESWLEHIVSQNKNTPYQGMKKLLQSKPIFFSMVVTCCVYSLIPCLVISALEWLDFNPFVSACLSMIMSLEQCLENQVSNWPARATRSLGYWFNRFDHRINPVFQKKIFHC